MFGAVMPFVSRSRTNYALLESSLNNAMTKSIILILEESPFRTRIQNYPEFSAYILLKQ